MPPTKSSSPPTERILVRGVNWLGDAVMSTCALQRLREAHPSASITVLSPAKLAGLWENQPFIDNALAFSPGQSILEVARMLRQQEFSTAVAFPNSIRSAMELWLAGIPCRIGRARPLRGLFLTQAVPPRSEERPMVKLSDAEIRGRISGGAVPPPISPGAHHAHDYLTLVSVLGASQQLLPPLIRVSEEQLAKFRARLQPEVSEGRPLLGLNPGAEYGPAKRWPAERFAAVAVALVKRTNCRWIIFGGPADQATAENIAAAIRSAGSSQNAFNVAGKTNLGELAAGLKLCEFVLTNDTGPMHLAAAVGTRVIVPFGSTSPELTGPLPAERATILRAGVPCSPCFRRECPIDLRCLNGITPEAVIEAALRLLEKRKPA